MQCSGSDGWCTAETSKLTILFVNTHTHTHTHTNTQTHTKTKQKKKKKICNSPTADFKLKVWNLSVWVSRTLALYSTDILTYIFSVDLLKSKINWQDVHYIHLFVPQKMCQIIFIEDILKSHTWHQLLKFYYIISCYDASSELKR